MSWVWFQVVAPLVSKGCTHGRGFVRRGRGSVRGDGGVVCGDALLPLPGAPIAACAHRERAFPSPVCVLDCSVRAGLCSLLLAPPCENFSSPLGRSCQCALLLFISAENLNVALFDVLRGRFSRILTYQQRLPSSAFGETIWYVQPCFISFFLFLGNA